MKKINLAFAAAILCALLHCPTVRAEDEVFLDSFFNANSPELLPEEASSVSPEFDFSAEALSQILNAGSDYADVEDFDIAGIMLGMPFESVRVLFFREAAVYSPAKTKSIVYSVPKNWRFNFDYECKQNKINSPAEVDKCVNSTAKQRGILYPSEIRLERPSTGEKINVHFTSNATGNLVWKVEYKNDANFVPGDDEKFAEQRENKILAFWHMVLEKYGAPNSGTNNWISTDNPFDPNMSAGYGELTLSDPSLAAEDEMNNVEDARDNFQSKPYAF